MTFKLGSLSVSLLSPNADLDRVPFSSPALGLVMVSASKGSTIVSKLQVHTRGLSPFTFLWSQAKCELELLGTRVRQRHVIWTRLEVRSYFPLTACLLFLWKLLWGRFSPSPNHCTPTSLSPGPHGDLNAPGWSWESIFHTLNKMCRSRVEGLFSITIWNILAFFPEFIIALGKGLTPEV